MFVVYVLISFLALLRVQAGELINCSSQVKQVQKAYSGVKSCVNALEAVKNAQSEDDCPTEQQVTKCLEASKSAFKVLVKSGCLCDIDSALLFGDLVDDMREASHRCSAKRSPLRGAILKFTNPQYCALGHVSRLAEQAGEIEEVPDRLLDYVGQLETDADSYESFDSISTPVADSEVVVKDYTPGSAGCSVAAHYAVLLVLASVCGTILSR